jgi:hypothetical protein
VAADQETRDRFNRALRGGEANAHCRPGRKCIQPFERQRQMRTTLVRSDGMYPPLIRATTRRASSTSTYFWTSDPRTHPDPHLRVELAPASVYQNDTASPT